MSEQPNLREWTRISQVLDVLLQLDDGSTISGTTRNISANGVLIDTDSILETGATFDVTLTRKDGDASITIKGRGEVVRSDGDATAVHLSSLIGEESYAYLRNLIVYNAADEAEKADQEFQDHIGLERHKD